LKALVVFGTRWGGTVDVAEKIGEVIKDEGYCVDIINAKKSPQNINIYDLVIIGSGIRADKWTKEASAFMEKNAASLRGKKTALFVSCQMADGGKESQDKAKKLYLEKTAELYGLKPIAFGLFGGFLDFSKSHGLLVDIIVRVNSKNLRKNGLDTRKVRDTRDWKIIEAWAREVAKISMAASAGSVF
jgi:menaquinone-dependent protoporphyrinogen oxidase